MDNNDNKTKDNCEISAKTDTTSQEQLADLLRRLTTAVATGKLDLNGIISAHESAKSGEKSGESYLIGLESEISDEDVPYTIVENIKPTNPNITFGDLLRAYESSKLDMNNKIQRRDNIIQYRRFRDIRSYIKNIKKHCKGLINVRAIDITTEGLKNWQKQTALKFPELTPQSIVRTTNCVRSVLKWGAEQHITSEYKITKLPLFKGPNGDAIQQEDPKSRMLEDDEIQRLMGALFRREKAKREKRAQFNHWRIYHHLAPLPEYLPEGEGFTDMAIPMIMFSLMTGARRGSTFGCKWKDIDFTPSENCPYGIVHLTAEMGKTHTSTYVPMTKELSEVLKIWKRQEGITDSEEDQSVFVFHAGDRHLIRVDTPSWWYPLLKDAKIDNFKWHGMRHTFGSRMVLNNVSSTVVSKLLGHHSVKMTERYLHSCPSRNEEAISVLAKSYDNIHIGKISDSEQASDAEKEQGDI